VSEFEVITITLSFILGLGITQILSGVVEVIRGPERVEADWIPLVWAWLIFLPTMQIWFWMWGDAQFREWTALWYSAWVGLASLLFLAGGLILPRKASAEGESLGEYFEHTGRRALAALGGFLVLAAVVNGYPSHFLTVGNILIYVLIPIVVTVAVSKRRRVRVIGTLLYLVIYMLGLVTVWAAPGRG
jgi:hypothetical protein